jgi:hypothetical protein
MSAFSDRCEREDEEDRLALVANRSLHEEVARFLAAHDAARESESLRIRLRLEQYTK